MLPLEVGKLYSCSRYFLLIYPDKKSAAAAEVATVRRRSSATSPAAFAATAAAYWTRELGKPVSYCNPKTPLLVLAVEEKYIEVLVGDKKGWIINPDWLELKELANEAA